MKTSDECLAKMEALCRRIADGWIARQSEGQELVEAAQEIVAMLPKGESDENMRVAFEIVNKAINAGTCLVRDGDVALRAALAGIERGRDLAKSGD